MNIDRSQRLEAYREVKAIIDLVGRAKLHAEEARTIVWAAEGLLLDADDAAESMAAFETLMDDLESHRWTGLVGDDANPGPARRLRAAVAGCAAEPVPAGV